MNVCSVPSCILCLLMYSQCGVKDNGGITSSILHCLFNQSFFRDFLHDAKQSHPPECENCECGR